MLEITELCSAYGQAQVLYGATLRVAEGEVVALLGRNGMGKTSLVRSVMGLATPRVTSGSILFNGTDLVGQRPYQISGRGVGYVPQGRRLFASLTVLEHLQMLERKAPGAWTVPRVFEAFPRLAERKQHRGSQLSGGERQMLAIGRALMTGPRILLMDEPFAALDEQTRLLLGDKITQIQQELNQTTLLITHNLTEAVQLSDRIVVMTYRPGKVKRIVDIKLPRPRTSDVVSSDAFGHYVAEIWADLREEATRGMAEAEQHVRGS